MTQHDQPDPRAATRAVAAPGDRRRLGRRVLGAAAALTVAGAALTVGLQAAIPDTPASPGPPAGSGAPRHSASHARPAAPSGGDADDETDHDGRSSGRQVRRVPVVAVTHQSPVATSGGSG